jgi:hypothetical protein
MIAWRCKVLAAVGAMAAVLLTACTTSSTSSSTPTSTSGGSSASSSSASISTKSDVCTSLDGLKKSVQDLRNTNIRASGISAISDQLTKINQQLSMLKSAAGGQYSPQISDMSTALSGLGKSLSAAKDNLNGGTLTSVASSAGAVVTAGNNLVTTVSHSC